MIPKIEIGDQLVCPVCGKEFTATEDTKYLVNRQYVCEWKCFLKRAKEPKQKTK